MPLHALILRWSNFWNCRFPFISIVHKTQRYNILPHELQFFCVTSQWTEVARFSLNVKLQIHVLPDSSDLDKFFEGSNSSPLHELFTKVES
ncbi:hypothetical protein GDO81_008879 [Engystomops pustulosus]|uniref:Uncharacterized protein n=1 Tax=Engystomops pustulosus TaxID=76066 RepID=A0AAV7BMJ7_ENGPU|nr:hypothetical protein GDO81_008879 [Engystomops pustulosus]KAG8573849.1 hypothetical protein GDO81_008879 [Engystomops pustulosus]KAG8573850.1 hypothetical protein GDO81_008879 [Engystomops pustulosus]KAG8573851.1 hypothetical protein GDO81_008879 [Engystomops pustulosus]KAG8573852.1 hypothetical protein GDO81_008879 [Engystomops pustulosus]